MQLVAVGAQDMYLTYNPEITFFDTAHKTHTNFAIESMEQTLTGAVEWGNKITANLQRTGDLVNSIYLQLDLPALNRSMFNLAAHPDVAHVCWCNSVGHAAIHEVHVKIAGVTIDKHYGRWLQIWDELTCKAEHRHGMNEMIGRYEQDGIGLSRNAQTAKTLYVPLQFWFNRNVGASLPLVALQFHNVEIVVELSNLNSLVVYLDGNGNRYRPANGEVLSVPNSAAPLTKASIFADYIFLDNDERARFAEEDHMYLCEQLQYHGQKPIPSFGTVNEIDIALSLNHPVKELIWTVQHSENYTEGPGYNDWFNYSSNGSGKQGPDSRDLLGTAQLKLNNHDRWTPERKASYFRLVQPANHHTRVPSKHIYCYSFALNPEDYQPSGTCNFSRIDSAKLVFRNANVSTLPNASAIQPASWDSASGRYEVYAWSVNQLKISGGLGGLQYAN
jgi:hypothetical protein